MINKLCLCCKQQITVKLADHNRGYGKYCSKSCAKKRKHKTIRISDSFNRFLYDNFEKNHVEDLGKEEMLLLELMLNDVFDKK